MPRGDATALAETLRDLALDPARTEELGAHAGARAARYAWPQVAAQVAEAYADARSVPQPQGATARMAVRSAGFAEVGGPRRPAQRLPSLEPALVPARRPVALVRRAAIGDGRRGAPSGSPISRSITSAWTGSGVRSSTPARRGCWSGSR